MRRGEVCWYTFKEPDKRRPVLILTRNTALGFLNAITVAPITSTIRNIPSEVYLDSKDDGVPQDCVINFDKLQTVPKEQLGAVITTLSQLQLEKAQQAINFALGFDDLV